MAGEAADVPAGFDWRAYLDRYADLWEAGIVDEAGALEHWRLFGRREGRRFASPSRPTKVGMGCASEHSLYLRASGALVCWDDAGGDHVLQPWDPAVDYGRDVFLGPVFDAIRRKLHEDRMPFPKLCRKCVVFRCQTQSSSYARDDRVIEQIQIEPTTRCALECPGCFSQKLRAGIAGSPTLALGVLEKVLGDLARRAIAVKVLDFQGHGDPLMCRDLFSLTRRAREIFPDSYATLCTSGIGIVRESVATSGLDEIVVSIDGASPESYLRYRVHGDFERAYAFARRCVEESHGAARKLRVVWKYILFEHNSTPEELLRAQELCLEAAIDEIVFVFTRNGPRSQTVCDPADVPRLPGGVPVRFSTHGASLRNLEQAVALASRRLAQGDTTRAGEMLAMVASNLERFFPSADALDAGHARVLAELLRLLGLHDPGKTDRPWRSIQHLAVDVGPRLVAAAS